MVATFGMSDVIGLVAIGEPEQEVFLGRELGHRRIISEHTARLVDQEIKRLLDEAHQRAREVLEQHKDLLETVAQALLERETLNRGEIETLERGEPLPPLPMPEEELLAPAASQPVEKPEKSAPPLGLPGSDGPLPGPAPGFYDPSEGEGF